MKHIKKDTLARTVVLALALTNQVLAVTGRELLPFAQEDVYQLISLLCTLISSGVAWWKNNSFTRHAAMGDLYMRLFQMLDNKKKEEKTQCESV